MRVGVREAVGVRSRGFCEHCGQALGSNWEAHHRLAGGMGGTSRERDLVSNVLALIPGHHNMTPDSVHMDAKRSRINGWLISTHDRRAPRDVPVLLWGTRWVLLDDDGGYAFV